MLLDTSTAIATEPARVDEPGTRRRSSRWTRLRRVIGAVLAGPRGDVRLGPADIVAVLEQARETVATGWVQYRWYAVSRSAPDGSSRDRGGADDVPENVAGACAVGAIALATRRWHARADVVVDAGPAIDHVWDAVQDASGRELPAAADRAWPQGVRLSRLRDIARWNDVAGRTKAEVLAVLDDAVGRAIIKAIRPSATSAP